VLAIILCIAAFVACYWAGRRSLGQGLVALFAFGYLYGILRANLLTTFSHFIFDAGLLGLYLSASFQKLSPTDKKRSEAVLLWTGILVLWPVLLVVMPFQPILISLVGLRGNIFFIPILLLASRLKGKDVIELSIGLAVLNIVALGFAGAEYFLGLERFFPVSPVTRIMYASRDVAGGFYRIPSCFTSAHAFGGTMIGSIPFVVGLWTEAQKRSHRLLGMAGIAAALLGVLMSATRTNFIFGSCMMLFLFFNTRMKMFQRVCFLLILGGIGIAALSNSRFQRFKTLDDTDYISERVSGSVNRGFFEVLVEYPMGNGLGGGGTSIPYFLEGQVRNPVGIENEYARIMAEQGVIGLILWLSFLAWFFSRWKVAFMKGPWQTSRKLLFCLTTIGFGTAWIGLGLLTSIPGTVMLLLGAGWAVVPPEAPSRQAAPGPARWALHRARTQVPAIS
jgi:hypothetical protein